MNFPRRSKKGKRKKKRKRKKCHKLQKLRRQGSHRKLLQAGKSLRLRRAPRRLLRIHLPLRIRVFLSYQKRGIPAALKIAIEAEAIIAIEVEAIATTAAAIEADEVGDEIEIMGMTEVEAEITVVIEAGEVITIARILIVGIVEVEDINNSGYLYFLGLHSFPCLFYRTM